MTDRSGRQVVVLATVAFGLVLTLHALLAPGFRASDEPQHLSTALRLLHGGGYPAPGAAVVDDAIAASYPFVGFPGLRELHAEQPLDHRPADLADPTLRELRAPELPRQPPQLDQMTQHPPGYYVALAAATAALGLEDETPATALLVLRLLSAAPLLLLPWLCWAVARHLGLSTAAAAASAWVPLAWPQIAVTGGTLNNGTPLVVCGALLAWLLLPVLRGATGVGRAAAVGAVLAVGLLTKGFALAFVGSAIIAYAAAAREAGARAALRAGAVVAAVAAAGLAWWVANVVRFGAAQPRGDDLVAWTSGREIDLPTWTWRVVRALSWSWWSIHGWLEDPLPWPGWVAVTVTALVLVGAGTWSLRSQPAALLVLHSLWLLPLAIVVYGSFDAWQEIARLRGVQGRYLQTGAVTACVLVAAGLSSHPVSRRALRVVPLVATLVALGGAWRALDWFWVRSDPGLPESWWPVPPGTVTALAVALLVVGVVAQVLAWTARPRSTTFTTLVGPSPGVHAS
jgi:4-amino-4-deoxy-L-arabinose transferase-like glycosyltransferase